MTKRKIESYLQEYVVGHFPGFAVRGDEMFAVPIGLVHRVVVFAKSGRDGTSLSHIYVAVTPLWQAFPALSLNYSDDLLLGDAPLIGSVTNGSAEKYFSHV